jgi:trigger factor
MQVSKKDLAKSQIELTVELSVEEFALYIEKGAKKISEEVKVEGFRKGKVPLEILKQKVGEMTILEEAANMAIHKTIDEAVEKNITDRQAVGQPQVNVTKLAPNNPLEYKVVVSILPTIVLGKYKDLGLKTEKIEVSDKEVEKTINELREIRAQEVLVDREIKKGDKAIIDIKMLKGNVPLEDGDHKEFSVLVGKDYFVPGFDAHLIGAKQGEEKKFNLVYPEKHHRQDLAGQKIDFVVKIKSVYERTLPELNDEFATFFQLKNLDELKKGIKENIEHEKQHQADMRNESELIGQIVAGTKFGELPEEIINSESRNMLAELEQSILRQGGKFEDYLKHLKKTKEQLILDMLPNAIKRVKSALVIRELAIVEKIAATEKEINEKIEEIKKQYAGNKEILKMLEEPGYHRYVSNILTNEKVIAKLKEWNYAPIGDKQKS